jgi:transposase-like protein
MSLTHVVCLNHLEAIRWNGSPICPYCQSQKSTPMRNEHRYHCGYCYTSYSAMVGTLFQRTHISLDKWFKAIFLICSLEGGVSVRQLAQEISTTNSTASFIKKRINTAKQTEPELLAKIANFYAEYMRNAQS